MILQELRIVQPMRKIRVPFPAYKGSPSHLENSDYENRLAIRVEFARQSDARFDFGTGIDLTSEKCLTK